MTDPLTPVTPVMTLGSPVSLSSTSTLFNDDLDPGQPALTKVTVTEVTSQVSNASAVLDKLQSILEYVQHVDSWLTIDPMSW